MTWIGGAARSGSGRLLRTRARCLLSLWRARRDHPETSALGRAPAFLSAPLENPMKIAVGAAIGGLFATLACAQSGPYESWIRAHYPDPLRITMQKVMSDANQAGIVADRTQMLALKRALRAIRAKARGGVPEFRRMDLPPASAASLPPVGVDTLVEHEFNDAWQYADTMSG